MGCQITSAYADQVSGRIRYPQPIMLDIMKRDYPQKINQVGSFDLNQISKRFQNQRSNQIPNQILSIYGLSQSYCTAFLFTTIINQNQYLVYNNGIFIIKIQKFLLRQMTKIKQIQQILCRNQKVTQVQKKKNQRYAILVNQGMICAMDVNQTLCCVGIYGGKIIVWELKHNKKIITIKLPKPSISFSSISINKKYIFVIDNSSPKNIAYCYDIQTTKLKPNGAVIINSLDPTLKGIKFLENHHVTICANGVWFIRYSQLNLGLDTTKGMFKKNIKTAQCSIKNIKDQYVLTGGVDGFVFLWNKKYQCIKSWQCFSEEIMAIQFVQMKSIIILSSTSKKTKCFTLQIKQQFKDQYKDQLIQDIQCAQIQLNDDQSTIQNIVVCKLKADGLLYFKKSTNGLLTSHLLPSQQPYPNKLQQLKNIQLIRFCKKGQIFIKRIISQFSSQIKNIICKNIYPLNSTTFNLDILQLCQNKNWWIIKQKKKIYVQKFKLRNNLNYFFSYCQRFNSLAIQNDKIIKIVLARLSVMNDNKVVVNFMSNQEESTQELKLISNNFSKNNQNQSIFELMKLDKNENLVSINYLQIQLNNHNIQNKNYSNRQIQPYKQLKQKMSLFFITCQQICYIYKVNSQKQYILQISVKFLPNKFNNIKLNQIEELQKFNIKDFQIYFDYKSKKWRIFQKQNQKRNQIFQFQKEMSKIHSSYLKYDYAEMEQNEKNKNNNKQKLNITVGGQSIIHWKQILLKSQIK